MSGGEHWYKLPMSSDYYKYAACTVAKTEDARFYDPTQGASEHGDAVCTIDCLMPHKNAILQLIPFENPLQQTSDCTTTVGGNQVLCRQALLEPVQFSYQPSVPGAGRQCAISSQPTITNIQAGQYQIRVRIFDITWGNPQNANLSDPTGLYDVTGPPPYNGSLYVANDPRLLAWRAVEDTPADFRDVDPVDTMNAILTDCAYSSDISVQEASLQNCRSTYIGIFGNIVGPTAPLAVLPTPLDLTPSMSVNCQYVYNVSNDIACPMIDSVCGLLTGNWRYSMSLMTPDQRLAVLPRHLCQNIVDYQQNKTAWLEPTADPDPNNTYFAGLGRQAQPDRLIPTLQPQSYSAYIYRSCALQEYTASPINCCANDFADGTGSLIFDPLDSQSPPVNPNTPPGSHRSPLIGYDYAGKGTPWYANCFDSGGLTCDTKYRDITADDCTGFMMTHCAINPETSSKDSWDIRQPFGSQECTRWLGRRLYGAKGEWVQFVNAVATRGQTRDLTGSKLTREILEVITQNFSKVFTMQQIADGTMTELGDAMEPVIFTLYQNYNLPLYDNQVLLTQCSVFSIDQVVKNPRLRRWCGCMLNSVSYQARYPEIAIACTPTCNSSDVIQYGAPCQGTICVLDKVTVDIIDSSVHGSVSIVQICQSCGQIYSSDTQTVKQTCNCKIGDVAISIIDSVVGTISISEMCGLDGNGGKAPVVPSGSHATRAVQAIGSATQTFPYTVVALLVAVCVLALTAFLIARGMKSGFSYLWARGLAVSALIISAIVIAAIVYYVVMKSLS